MEISSAGKCLLVIHLDSLAAQKSDCILPMHVANWTWQHYKAWWFDTSTIITWRPRGHDFHTHFYFNGASKLFCGQQFLSAWNCKIQSRIRVHRLYSDPLTCRMGNISAVSILSIFHKSYDRGRVYPALFQLANTIAVTFVEVLRKALPAAFISLSHKFHVDANPCIPCKPGMQSRL